MTTDAVQLLRDHWGEVPDADEETVQRAYAYATSSRTRRWRGAMRLPYVPPLRPRFAVPAAAAIVTAAVCAFVFTGAFGGSGAQRANEKPSVGSGSVGRGGKAMLSRGMTLDFTRSGQAITSIDVTVRAYIPNAVMRLQVFRSDSSQPPVNYTSSQLVYQEQAPMTNLAFPLMGEQAEWSGSLSPSDWNGGCQNALYMVWAEWVPAGTSFDGTPSSEGSAWFRCSSDSGG